MAREFFIGGQRIADDEPPFVIAEIGHNHGGSLKQAERLFAVAKACGCNAVKLQKRSNRDLYTRAMYDAPYNSEHAYGATYGEHREALEFGWEEYCELKALADELGLLFFVTAFDIPSVDFLSRLGMTVVKIASGDLTNHQLLGYCIFNGLSLIVSTGGHDMEDVDRAVRFLQCNDAKFALLQATAAYPCPHKELNLRVIETYRQRYPEVVIGLSDHQDGISMAPVAWMLGARIFEKHFTLSRAAKGSDNAFSLEPEPMRRMVNDLHGVAAALGDGIKGQYPSEAGAMLKMGKSLVAARDLPAGHRVMLDDVAVKSPGGGIKPSEIGQVWGKYLICEMREDEPFTRIALEQEERHTVGSTRFRWGTQ